MKLSPLYIEILNESSRQTINNINNLILIRSSFGLIILFNPTTKTPIGYISLGVLKHGYHPVYSIYSDNGFGPLLYELAMTSVYPNGITLDDSSPTSSEALNVWNKFYTRSDVKKEPINRGEASWKEREMVMNCNGDVNCLRQIRKILDLHDLKFTYSLGKTTLDKLASKGDEYLKQNPNLDVNDIINYLKTKYDN